MYQRKSNSKDQLQARNPTPLFPLPAIVKQARKEGRNMSVFKPTSITIIWASSSQSGVGEAICVWFNYTKAVSIVISGNIICCCCCCYYLESRRITQLCYSILMAWAYGFPGGGLLFGSLLSQQLNVHTSFTFMFTHRLHYLARWSSTFSRCETINESP